jgi:hypothetical protein
MVIDKSPCSSVPAVVHSVQTTEGVPMTTTDKLEMLKEQLEHATDQMKRMVEALRTPTPCDCCFTDEENAENYRDFENYVRDLSNECQEIAMKAYECYTAMTRAPLEIALAQLEAMQEGHRLLAEQ